MQYFEHFKSTYAGNKADYVGIGLSIWNEGSSCVTLFRGCHLRTKPRAPKTVMTGY